MAAIVDVPARPAAGIYFGSARLDGIEQACLAVFPYALSKNGDQFYFSWQNNASEPRHVEFVTLANWTPSSTSKSFNFNFGGVSYSAILTNTITISPTDKPDRKVTIDYYFNNEVYELGKDVRVWTGSTKLLSQNETSLVAFVAPQGIANGLPAIAVTKAVGANPLPLPKYIIGHQKMLPNPPGSFELEGASSTVMATLDDATHTIDIRFGSMINTVALVTLAQEWPNVDTHFHDFTPPKPFVEKVLTEVRYPQPTAALQRIRSEMPFPSTLVDTLTQTASFVDQAGYLAKYAVDRYTELDKAYHTAKNQNTESSKEIQELKDKVASDESEMKRLAAEDNAEKKKNEELTKSLADARDAAAKREAELTKKIQELQNTVTKEQTHDAEDHKALDEAHKALAESQAANLVLQKTLDQTEAALHSAQNQVESLTARLQEMTKKYSDATAEISDLKGKLEAEQTENKTLKDENKTLKEKIAKLEKDIADLELSLKRTEEDLKKATSDLANDESIITGLEAGIEAMKKDRDAKKTALDELKKRTDAIIKDLQDQITAAKAHDLEDHKKIADGEDALNKAKAHDADDHTKLSADEAKIKELEGEIDRLKPSKPDRPVRSAVNRMAEGTDLYFMLDDKYVRCNGIDDTSLYGPRTIAAWWPALYKAGIQKMDATLLTSPNTQEGYMFYGDKCTLYHITNDKILGEGVFNWTQKWSCLRDAGITWIDTVMPHFYEGGSAVNHATFFSGAQCIRIDISTNKVVQGLTDIAKAFPVLAGFSFVDTFAFKVQKNFVEGYFFSGPTYILVHLVEKRILWGPTAAKGAWKGLARVGFY